MKEYLDILKYVALEGVKKDDRTNTGVSSVFNGVIPLIFKRASLF